MTKIKIGDYAIPPKGCRDSLTAGEKYEIIEVLDVDAFRINSDNKGKLFCMLKECAHLNDQNWIIEPKNNHEHNRQSTSSVQLNEDCTTKEKNRQTSKIAECHTFNDEVKRIPKKKRFI